MNSLKNILLIATMIFSLISCNSNNSQNGGKLTFISEKIHDFGKIEYAQDGTHNFIFQNTGKKPLVITNVKSTCGCTVPSYPSRPILKGETDTIKVKYDTRRRGRFTKTIKIYSTSTDTSYAELMIRGEVLPPA